MKFLSALSLGFEGKAYWAALTINVQPAGWEYMQQSFGPHVQMC
jgi:hypothetical protein